MPITKSAKKALRQSKRRAAQNLRRKNAYKKLLKQIQNLAAAGKTKEAEAIAPQAYKALDKAAKNGVLKPNAASRYKSRLMTWIRKSKSAA
ncbi:MAG: 30S ribosomal protein S20 [Candidatus Sungbacteria bacterium]|uniref:Small ribosomal subunit protein bS20 n=1 Tax=Candidatus Sungiibacteriota bacterium TaxID=2750080 RepID=A0A933DRG4_9BACT|nr:30S ribosomal protein S20 [Candidatus Sungbacteria bacterium]